MGLVLLIDEAREKNIFECNKEVFLNTSDEEAWQSFLSKFNQTVEDKVKLDGFKEELRSTVEVEKTKTTTEPVVTRSRPESRMEVDEAPRSSGRFNLDRVAQENMNEGLETWTPPELVPSVRNLEANRVRPLKDITLPGLTSSSTSGSQSGTGTSRLRNCEKGCRRKLLRTLHMSSDQPPGEIT